MYIDPIELDGQYYVLLSLFIVAAIAWWIYKQYNKLK